MVIETAIALKTAAMACVVSGWCQVGQMTDDYWLLYVNRSILGGRSNTVMITGSEMNTYVIEREGFKLVLYKGQVGET